MPFGLQTSAEFTNRNVANNATSGAPAGSYVAGVEANTFVQQVIALGNTVSAQGTVVLPTITTYSVANTYTFTPKANTVYIIVKMQSSGGGGAGSGGKQANGAAASGSNLAVPDGTAGGNAANTSFGSLVITGGIGGALGGSTGSKTGGTGGAVVAGSSPLPYFSRPGATGGNAPSGYFTYQAPGKGGGAGGGLSVVGSGAADASSFGGGGAGGPDNGQGAAGASGGEGGEAEFLITSPIANSYTVVLGAVGAAGTAGTGGYAGGKGYVGRVIIQEFAR